jgi:hypothetical protein
VDASVNAEVVDCAAAVSAKHAGCVRVVHHHDRAVALGRIAQRGQRAATEKMTPEQKARFRRAKPAVR